MREDVYKVVESFEIQLFENVNIVLFQVDCLSAWWGLQPAVFSSRMLSSLVLTCWHPPPQNLYTPSQKSPRIYRYSVYMVVFKGQRGYGRQPLPWKIDSYTSTKLPPILLHTAHISIFILQDHPGMFFLSQITNLYDKFPQTLSRNTEYMCIFSKMQYNTV